MTKFFFRFVVGQKPTTPQASDVILHAVDPEIIKLRSQVPFILKQSKHGTVFEKNWTRWGWIGFLPGYTSFSKGDEAHLCVLAYRQS